MAMLAEPRQKKRYNLTPKGKPLFEDNDRFGTKMLEKMGWSKGKGLGKLEDGNQEFVRLKYKSDEQGLGFQERDDQWTEHEKNFNGLLENLNGGKNSDSDENEVIRPAFGVPIVGKSAKKLKDKISGQSLEEKSKTSKARVHYKKFTKGKDMSQYSEKDLANIFGKKATPEEVNIYSQFQAFATNGNDDSNAESKIKDAAPKDELPEKEHGTPIINTGVSVSDYFKSKMAAIKEKLGTQSSNPFGGNIRVVNNVEVFVPTSKRKAEEQSEPEECEAPRKKKKTKSLDTEDTALVAEPAETEKNEADNVPEKKKKKKSKKESEPAETLPEETNEGEAPKKKKKNKKRQLELEPTAVDQNQPECNIEECNSSKKKKKSKNPTNEEITVTVQPEDEIPKKKKKKDNKDVDTTEPVEKDPSTIEQTESNTKTKKKKSNKAEVSAPPILDTTYTISTFCAEKFRILELPQFLDSNLTNIIGYGLSENFTLNIVENSRDIERITRLWNGTLDKYTHSTLNNKVYSAYMDKAKRARKNHNKIPNFKLSSLKRKQIFQCV